MIKKILSGLGLDTLVGDMQISRRRHMRRPGLRSKVVMNHNSFNVKDWSMGGFLLQGDTSAVKPGEKVDFVMQFDLPHATITIQHEGRIIRTAQRGVAAEFMPLSPDVRRKFGRVIDGLNALTYTESQAEYA